MTAMKDALTKAGMNTAGPELHGLAIEAIRAAKGSLKNALPKFTNVLQKRRDLLNELARDYLTRVAADMGEQKAPTATPKKEWNVREHKRHRHRTEQEREAALRSGERAAEVLASVYDRRIDGRPIGNMRWGELHSANHNNAIAAASYLRLGTERTEDFILLDMIERHANVTDHTTRVRDVVSAAQLAEFMEQARHEAPRWVDRGMQAYIASLESQRTKEIAP